MTDVIGKVIIAVILCIILVISFFWWLIYQAVEGNPFATVGLTAISLAGIYGFIRILDIVTDYAKGRNRQADFRANADENLNLINGQLRNTLGLARIQNQQQHSLAKAFGTKFGDSEKLENENWLLEPGYDINDVDPFEPGA